MGEGDCAVVGDREISHRLVRVAGQLRLFHCRQVDPPDVQASGRFRQVEERQSVGTPDRVEPVHPVDRKQPFVVARGSPVDPDLPGIGRNAILPLGRIERGIVGIDQRRLVVVPTRLAREVRQHQAVPPGTGIDRIQLRQAAEGALHALLGVSKAQRLVQDGLAIGRKARRHFAGRGPGHALQRSGEVADIDIVVAPDVGGEGQPLRVRRPHRMVTVGLLAADRDGDPTFRRHHEDLPAMGEADRLAVRRDPGEAEPPRLLTCRLRQRRSCGDQQGTSGDGGDRAEHDLLGQALCTLRH